MARLRMLYSRNLTQKNILRLLRPFTFFVSIIFIITPLFSEKIRVLLTQDGKEVLFQDSFLLLVDSRPKKKIRNETINFTLLKSLYPHARTLEFRNEGGKFRIASQSYQGDLIIQNTDNPLLINRIDVEDYVKGVLPNEISPLWPLEVLKAQAVATRTFAYYYILQNRTNSYDLTDTTFSQVYKGFVQMNTNFSKAMESTKDTILTFENEPIQAFFHSTCGGHTEDALKVWGKHVPYLTGVPCSFCQNSLYYNWEAEFTQNELQEKLKKYDLEKVRAILPEKISSSGRWVQVKIIGLRKSISLSGNSFRILLGTERIKSTKFKIIRQGNDFILKGHGWGHGVGFCQWGAKTMAEKGYRYYQILRYYYRGTQLKKL